MSKVGFNDLKVLLLNAEINKLLTHMVTCLDAGPKTRLQHMPNLQESPSNEKLLRKSALLFLSRFKIFPPVKSVFIRESGNFRSLFSCSLMTVADVAVSTFNRS